MCDASVRLVPSVPLWGTCPPKRQPPSRGRLQMAVLRHRCWKPSFCGMASRYPFRGMPPSGDARFAASKRQQTAWGMELRKRWSMTKRTASFSGVHGLRRSRTQEYPRRAGRRQEAVR
jgi:hypothetical protein